MSLYQMSMTIIKICKLKYKKYIDDECFDVIQLINICKLCKAPSNKTNEIDDFRISDIELSSPLFIKSSPSTVRKQIDILKSTEFKKKYSFFIKIIYACLKLDIEIFDINPDIITLKNNYNLMKTLITHKKELITYHQNIIKEQLNSIEIPLIKLKINSENKKISYETYISNYLKEVKIIDKIFGYLNQSIDSNILTKTDNLISLIIPYFYNYTEYIEVYN